MIIDMIKDDEHEHEFLFRFCKGISANFSVRVVDGELTYVAHWGEYNECSHDIKEHPHWEHAEALLESFAQYNPKEFYDIAKLLNPSSRGFKVVKSIVEKQIADGESKISKVMEEAEFWKKCL